MVLELAHPHVVETLGGPVLAPGEAQPGSGPVLVREDSHGIDATRILHHLETSPLSARRHTSVPWVVPSKGPEGYCGRRYPPLGFARVRSFPGDLVPQRELQLCSQSTRRSTAG